jgi:gamma-glutamyltranspeptidase/glutathione hydrolase
MTRVKLVAAVYLFAGLGGMPLGFGICPAAAALGETGETRVYWGTETLEAQQLESQYAAKKGTMGQAPRAMIAACHNRSVNIGLAVLAGGGNAVDAFVALTFADYVQAPGTSSIGGPLGVLMYSTAEQKVVSLVAPLKTVTSPTGQWRVGETALGKQVLVPGAVAGLEALQRKHGKLPWRELVMPAAKLARDGFVVDYLYAAIVSNYASTLKPSAYARATYFQADGAPIQVGATIKLPVLAETLEAIAEQGSAYLQQGAWAKEAVAVVRAAGGELSPDDLADYQPEWTKSLRIAYRGQEVYGLGGHNSGGVRLLLGLEVLAHTDIKMLGHYSESLDGLETMIRISRAVNTAASLGSQRFYDDPQASQALLNSSRAEVLWQDVVNKTDRTPQAAAGSHSYSVVVVDVDGNAVAGTHTIESLPFGSGLFVGGVPLNNTGILHPFKAGEAYSTPPGSYIIEPLSVTLAFKDKQLVLASSTFSASLWPADFELVSSALDFDWSPERIALTPRFGGYAIDLGKLTADLSTTQLDKRYSRRVVDELKSRGLIVSQAGYIDTGMLVVVRRDPKTGALTGFTPEQIPDGKAAGH